MTSFSQWRPGPNGPQYVSGPVVVAPDTSMHDLAFQLSDSIDRLMQSNYWTEETSEHNAIRCAMQAIAQQALTFCYGNDGAVEFNRLENEKFVER